MKQLISVLVAAIFAGVSMTAVAQQDKKGDTKMEKSSAMDKKDGKKAGAKKSSKKSAKKADGKKKMEDKK